MASSLSDDLPAESLQHADQLRAGDDRHRAAHAGNGSLRRTMPVSSVRPSSRRPSTYRLSASRALSVASSSVSPWVWSPGRSGHRRGSHPRPGARRRTRSRALPPCAEHTVADCGADWRLVSARRRAGRWARRVAAGAGGLFELARRCGLGMSGERRHSVLYELYMHSPIWQARRRWWFVTSDRRCSRCGRRLVLHGGGAATVTVHHRTYARLGHERREDVQLCC